MIPASLPFLCKLLCNVAKYFLLIFLSAPTTHLELFELCLASWTLSSILLTYPSALPSIEYSTQLPSLSPCTSSCKQYVPLTNQVRGSYCKLWPVFIPSIYGPGAKYVIHKSKGKTRVRNLQFGPKKLRLVRYLLYLFILESSAWEGSCSNLNLAAIL